MDTLNHCIRILSRLTNTTAKASGQCRVSGFQDGAPTETKFSEPKKAVKVPGENQVIISDSANQKLRVMELDDYNVSTFASLSQVPLDVTFGPDNNTLFFSFAYGIGSITGGNVNTLVSSSGFSDGDLGVASFGEWIDSLRIITDNLMLIADYSNDVFRIIDFTHNTTSTVCRGAGNSNDVADGSVDNCTTFAPKDSIPLDDERYVLLLFEYSIGTLSFPGR